MDCITDRIGCVRRDRPRHLTDDTLFVRLVSPCVDDWSADWLAFICALCHQFVAGRRCVVDFGIPIHVVDRADFLFILWNLSTQTECVDVFPGRPSTNTFRFADQQFICLDHVLDRRRVELPLGDSDK